MLGILCYDRFSSLIRDRGKTPKSSKACSCFRLAFDLFVTLRVLIFEIELAKNKVERKLNFPGARVEKARPFYSYSLLIYNLNLRL